MSIPSTRAAIIGAGSWGTALAVHLGSAGKDVTLWVREPELAEVMNATRVNSTFLPGVVLPDRVRPSTAMADVVSGAQFVIVAAPSHAFRAVVRQAGPHLPAGAILVSATKGLETDRLARMSEVLVEETGGRHPIVVLSGPSFAAEVARRSPTALVAASTDPPARRAVQEEFKSPDFRLYGSDDVIGVELGAALKNVIAIAAGGVEALELGHNAMAALITRGLAEMSRLACAMGARRDTLAGLSGLGDLVLTCTGSRSRNRQLGIELGKGRSLVEVLGGMHMVAEGVNTTAAALALGARHGVDLPIAAEMAAVFAGQKTPREAVGALMLRPQRDEWDGD
jgi:glycerol-3-phosphate dehydrogenase (NAD(P)+)